MNTKEKVALIFERFIHRPDVFATQWYDETRGGGYRRQISGTCPMNPPCPKKTCPHIKNIPIAYETILAHLRGEETLGIYQLSEDNTVKWLCFDVDLRKGTEENDLTRQEIRAHTLRLAKRLAVLFGKGSFLVERSGSKGYHLWVFFSTPVQAFQVYSLGRWIDANTAPSKDYIGVEVFPKQTAIDSFGNMLKLPLGVHKKTNVRCFFVNGTFEDIADQWEALANVRTITDEELKKVISEYDVSVALTIRVDSQQAQTLGAIPCISNMMEEGLIEGTRDLGMLKIASWLKRRGFKTRTATLILHDVNAHSNPPFHDDIINKKVESAYTSDYSEFPCRHNELDSYCSSTCFFFGNKSRDRWKRYGKEGDGAGVISRD